MVMHNHKQFLNYNINKNLKEQYNELKPIKKTLMHTHMNFHNCDIKKD